MEQIEKARHFASLHEQGSPLILYNIWDAGTAKAAEQADAKAVATGSWSVAAAQGFGDGEKIPLDLLLTIVQRIVDTVALPVSVDFEGAYGTTPEQVAASTRRLIGTGAIGMNVEDRIVGGEGLYDIAAQAYAAAGASGFFVPGLVDAASIGALCRDTALPVNVMVMDGTPSAGALADLGVARISHGPGPYRTAMQQFGERARTVLSGG
ncbi:isocitrate lyase/PEP mutase family protein [Oceanibaculum indicum]|uniref:2-methylisocitrate lyase-like PEP mutase family enzyme n=1 Tax=Oceanibaculum indicum TaxID=526216 RepID=A0A420WQX3_9PROT|nr:isocitrate lyase/phosphoenolpyruvate mutase family protein [Oceanibaculum indicum]RKQ73305.1 2-methylisocitrate lyase-like PEP mutase family enzyme [Oceanibaculum indicum]